PHLARYSNNLAAWGAKINDDPNDYLQIDLGRVYKICAVATKGHEKNNEFVDSYKVLYSMDNLNWGTYQETAGEDKHQFEGNKDAAQVRVNWFIRQLRARYIRINPTAWHSSICLRAELFGCQESCDQSPLGLEDHSISNSHITSSSKRDQNSPAHHGRLGFTSANAWCAASDDTQPWIQFDLGADHVVCAIATQGDSKSHSWVTSYKVMYSDDAAKWFHYSEAASEKEFLIPGSKDRFDTAKHVLQRPVVAKFIRVYPVEFYSHKTMRIDAFG
ncbi:predicted protein, partial [Nematostella vectensis]